MSSLRERKKEQSRQRMLASAKELFIERGYARTTMEDIAEHADFGVATLYNYFNTKEGMFATMAREDMGILRSRGEALLAEPCNEPVEAVCRLLRVYRDVFEFISYDLLLEFEQQLRVSGPLNEVANWVASWERDQISRALQSCQEQQMVSADLDCDLVAEVVVDQLIRFNQRRGRDICSETLDDRLRQVIQLMCEGWGHKQAAGEIGWRAQAAGVQQN